MSGILKDSQELTSTFIEALVPDDSKLRKKLATKSKLHKDTLGKLKQRNSLSADTLFRLCLANDISSSAIKILLKKKGDGISKGTVEWIKFGSKLSEKDIEVFLSVLKKLKEHYLLKK